MSFARSSSVKLFTNRAKDYISDDFVIVNEDEKIEEALNKIQTQKKSAILVVNKKKLSGIITEQDIVRRVLNQNYTNKIVKDYMTSPVEYIYDYDLLFHAIGIMRKNKLRHLPVVNMNEEVIGILNLHVALSVELNFHIESIDELTSEVDRNGIISLKDKQKNLAEKLINDNVSSFDVSYVLSFLNLVIYRRAIRIAISETNQRNIIETVPDFCVLIMGSGGRMESYIRPDQDNGIIYDLETDDQNLLKKTDEYFLEVSKIFTKILDDADIPFCEGDLMASNPLWRKSLTGWKTQIDEWVQSANDNNLRYMDMLYDFQPVYGNSNLAKDLRTFLMDRLYKTPHFLKYLYKRDEGTNAAIGFFGQFILEKEDKENLGLLNLKHTGTLPLVESIRMYSIKHKVDQPSTLERLSELTNKGVFRKDEYDFFKNAYEFLAELLIKNQIKSFKKNNKISNFIDPKKLTQREKTVLKIYLKKIKELKTRLKADFGEEYV